MENTRNKVTFTVADRLKPEVIAKLMALKAELERRR